MKYPPSLAIKVSDSLGAHSERDHREINFFSLLIESSEIQSDTDFAVFLRKSFYASSGPRYFFRGQLKSKPENRGEEDETKNIALKNRVGK